VALLAHWPDGRIKQATLTRLLAERAERPDFYAIAAYEPVDAAGPRADHVIAYRRADPVQEGGDLFVAVPRLVASLVGEAVWSGEAFAGTRVDLGAGTRWRDLVSGRIVESEGEGADLGDLLRDLPYAVLRREA